MEENGYKIESDDGDLILPQIEEFHFDYALSLIQDEGLLYTFLKDFQKNLETVPQKLENLYAAIDMEDGLGAYRSEVHALKSTAATVGALLLSQTARLLEIAAIDVNPERIHVLHPILMEELQKHKIRLNEALPSVDQEEGEEIESEYLEMLITALQMEDYNVADFIMSKIMEKRYAKQLQTLIEALAEQVFNLQVQDALDTIDKIIS